MKPIGDTPNNFVEKITFTVSTGLSIIRTFDYDATIQLLELQDITSYNIKVNDTNLSPTATQFYVSRGDEVTFTVCCSIDSSLTLGIHLG